MPRKCQACGTQLSRYNDGKLCFPCQRKRREESLNTSAYNLTCQFPHTRVPLVIHIQESVKVNLQKGKVISRHSPLPRQSLN